MSPSLTTSRHIRPLCRVVFSLRGFVMMLAVLVVCSWMQSASATCGNYLFRNGKPASAHTMTVDTAAGVQQNDGVTANVPPVPPVAPCSGPNCSRSRMPLVPVPAAPSNLIRNFDQATILEVLSNASQMFGAMEIPTSERGACYVPSSIFRPPASV